MATTMQPAVTNALPAPEDAELRGLILNEFAAAIEAARDAVSRVDGAPTLAVHEYRKALRRARAIFDLVVDELPSADRRAVRRALREARRAVAVARDHAVAPEAVDLLALEPPDLDTARTVLESAAQQMPAAGEIKQALAVGAARAAAQVEVLETALPAAIHWAIVIDGVRTRYRDARRACKNAKRSKRAFHAWRKRSKELVYQLQTLAGYTGSGAAELYRELQQASDQQGDAVDLIMLRAFVRSHGDAVPRRKLSHLVREIDAQLADRIATSRDEARLAFRTKPRKFARKLTAAVGVAAAS